MRHILTAILTAISIVIVITACSHDSGTIADSIEFSGDGQTPVVRETAATGKYRPGNPNPLTEMPGNCVAIERRNLGNLAELFNDSNYIHWAEAEKIGIEPLSDMRSHWQLRKPIHRIESCEDFWVEELTYSQPYLVGEAVAMVHEVGRRFRDTLKARGGGDYRIRITSVLRTPDAVRRLRRVNRNAIDSSVHQLGTTVDISYANFTADTDRVPRRAEDLKAILAEVLYAMRAENKCYVKYERHQPCFHITARAGALTKQ